jgi:predicted glutamine amidotransferase
MCQLTLLDISDQKLARALIRPLTELNTLGVEGTANNDGFGYMTFAKAGEVFKSKDSAQEWWPENQKEFNKRHRNINGIYHVRAASYTNKKYIEDQFSHPFNLGNIVLAHNGTLTYQKNGPDKDKLKAIPDDLIDTQEFVFALEVLRKNDEVLTADHINKTLKNFTGVFAFLMWDKLQPKKIFIVRDDIKTLFKMQLFNDGKPFGIIVNTKEWELEYIVNIIGSIGKLLGHNLTYTIEKLTDMSIFEYKMGSYEIGEKIGTIVKPTFVMGQTNNRARTTPYTWQDDRPYLNVTEHMLKLQLTYTEILVMSEVIFNKSILVFDKDEMDEFAEILEELEKKHNHRNRMKAWANLRKKTPKIDRMDLYEKFDLEFPFFFNSKSHLKKAEKRA